MSTDRAALQRWLPWAWSTLLALLLLGPALGPGYVLTYDMVWVPDLALRPDVWGVGSALPRAVPSDAVVALLDEVVPGALLQKVALLVPLVLAGAGSARLVGRTVVGGLVAATVAVWSPFVAERLLIGHWPVLWGYAVLPWLLLAARRWHDTGRLPAVLLVLLPLGSLSASTGLVTAVLLVACTIARRPRRLLVLAALLAAANAPWLVTGLLHAGSAYADPVGARVFALADEGRVPGPVAALALGGIWNSEVVPGSRTGAAGLVWLVALLGLAVAGARRWWARTTRREAVALLVCWGLGWGWATLTWAWPAASAWAGAHVPGGAVLRDGGRALALCAPLVAVLAGHGAARVAAVLPRAARPAAAVALVMLPVATMPDVALGWAGRLQPTAYPADLGRARDVVTAARDRGQEGDALVLPLTSYRQPSWNGDRKVLDPTGRLLSVDTVTGDDLSVSGRRVAGEDPRVRAARRALAAPDPAARARALARMGVGFVVTERDAGPAPAVDGRRLLTTASVRVQALEDVRPERTPTGQVVAAGLAWAAFFLLPVVSTGLGLWRRRRASDAR